MSGEMQISEGRIYRGGCVTGGRDEGVKVGHGKISSGADVIAQQVHSCLPHRSRLILHSPHLCSLPDGILS